MTERRAFQIHTCPNRWSLRITTLLLCLVLASMGSLPAQQEVAQDGKRYNASWSSLKQHKAVPEWLKDAKFGIYTHWGPCSVANQMVPDGAAGWYGRKMYQDGSRTNKAHKKKLGHPSEFGYHDFIPKFKAENFDAEEWAKLFKRAGAKFAGPVAEHHDGFAMWDSQHTPWDAAEKGPNKDIVGRLEKTIRAHGMKFFLSFHHAACNRWHTTDDGVKKPWWFPKSDELGNTDPKYRTLYGNMPAEEFYQLWRDKFIEAIDAYEPNLLWHDSGLNDIPASYRQNVLAHYFNRAHQWGIDVGFAYKQEDLPEEVGILDHERGIEDHVTDYTWINDDSAGAWFYDPNNAYGSSKWVVHRLIETVSRNGILLLNLPPKPDGTFSESVKQCMKGTGNWLEVNGDAIYNTRPWKTYGHGDVRYTRSKDGRTLYAIAKQWPGSGPFTPPGVHVENDSGGEVRLLGHDQLLEYSVKNGALQINVPELEKENRPSKHAHAFKITGFELAYHPPGHDALSLHKPARASNVFQNQVDRHGPSRAVDGNLQTRWATDADVHSPWIEMDLEEPSTVGRIEIREAYAPRIQSHSLEYWKDGAWKTAYRGKQVGKQFERTFDPVKARKFRLNIHEASKGPTISEIWLYGPKSK